MSAPNADHVRLTRREQRLLDQLKQHGWNGVLTRNGGLWTERERHATAVALRLKGIDPRTQIDGSGAPSTRGLTAPPVAD